ncbi:hypothetical protein SeMB42_g07974, partial [Synchytrium endobioticum]
MANLVKVGVVAFLIFCTLAQTAPTRQKDVFQKAVKKLVNAKGDTTRRGMKTLAGVPAALISHHNPEDCIFSEIAAIAAKIFPTSMEYTIDELLSPLDAKILDGDRIRLARAYLACVFERLKFLFECINHEYYTGFQKKLVGARALVWKFLLIFKNRGATYYGYNGISGPRSLELMLPDDKACLVQHVSEPSHETALSRDMPSSDDVQRSMEQLKEQMKIWIADWEASGRLVRKSQSVTTEWLHSDLKGRNAHGNDESFPPMMVESNDAVNESTPNPDNSIEYFNFFENNIDHGAHHDHPTTGLIDVFGKSEAQALESLDLTLGMHDPERLKGATLRIREPSPLALSSSHWHDSEPSSHSYDKGKRPM